MIDIKEILKQKEIQIDEAKKKSSRQRIYCDISSDQFLKLIIKEMELIMAKQGNQNKLELEPIKEVINQLYYYTKQDNRFNGDLGKGIYLEGNYGVGKTLILTAYCRLLMTLKVKPKVYIQHAKEIVQDLMNNPELISESLILNNNQIMSYKKRLLMIDDLGKEPLVVNNFGTQSSPMEDIISARYDNRTLTFATGNKKFDTFKDVYSRSIYERMKELFNVIILTGKSKR